LFNETVLYFQIEKARSSLLGTKRALFFLVFLEPNAVDFHRQLRFRVYPDCYTFFNTNIKENLAGLTIWQKVLIFGK